MNTSQFELVTVPYAVVPYLAMVMSPLGNTSMSHLFIELPCIGAMNLAIGLHSSGSLAKTTASELVDMLDVGLTAPDAIATAPWRTSLGKLLSDSSSVYATKPPVRYGTRLT